MKILRQYWHRVDALNNADVPEDAQLGILMLDVEAKSFKMPEEMVDGMFFNMALHTGIPHLFYVAASSPSNGTVTLVSKETFFRSNYPDATYVETPQHSAAAPINATVTRQGSAMACMFQRSKSGPWEHGFAINESLIVDLDARLVQPLWNFKTTPSQGCILVSEVIDNADTSKAQTKDSKGTRRRV